jgi:hypothetical protein
MIIEYEAPAIEDLGSIADHTYRGFGPSDKVRKHSLDKWSEFRDAAGS